MKGYPKHFNTKEDVMNAKEIDPQRTNALLRAAIDGREGWYVTGPLAAETDGITDDTHRVVDHGDKERGEDWYQEQWGPLPGNQLDRLGISVEEAEKIITENENVEMGD